MEGQKGRVKNDKHDRNRVELGSHLQKEWRVQNWFTLSHILCDFLKTPALAYDLANVSSRLKLAGCEDGV